MKNSFLTYLYLFLALLGLFAWYSVNISPSVHWIFIFVPLSIPFLLLIHLLFLIFWIMKKRWVLTIICLFILVLAHPFFSRTISWNTPDEGKPELSLLSYNVRVFNSYSHLKEGGRTTEKILRFASDHTADVKCFQEFYNYPAVDSYQTVKRVKKQTPYYFFKPVQTVEGQGFGLAIFSKYPIVGKGEVAFPHQTYNQAIYADVALNKDTIRIFNIHLQSMSIGDDEIPNLDKEENKSRIKKLYRKLKRGAEYRSQQINALISEIRKSPYRVVLAGDLNDTPYSYSYEKLREIFRNAFEEKGRGFGFTYNGKLFFLRIDNIFYDEKLSLRSFKIENKITYSDHFPLVATFDL